MQPLFAAFVDTPGFQVMVIGFLLVLGLSALAVLVLVTRWGVAGVRRWRHLTAAPGPVSLRQRLPAVLLLLPAVGLVLWGLFRLGFSLVTQHTQRQQWAELQTQKAVVARNLPGRYVLADTLLWEGPHEERVTGRVSAHGWSLPDTFLTVPGKPYHKQGEVEGTLLAPTRRPTPTAELELRTDGTYTYHTTIAGDLSGHGKTGKWSLECVACQEAPYGPADRITRYAPVFRLRDHLTGSYYPTGGLRAQVEQGRIRFQGGYRNQGRLVRFDLIRAEPAATTVVE